MTLYERIQALRERGRQYETARALNDAIRADNVLKQEIQNIYKQIFGKGISGCSNCITDAFFELINTKNIMEKIELEYQLKAGALLRDVVTGSSKKAVSNVNLTKETALYHLATNPNSKRLFVKLPKGYLKEVSEFIAANQEVADFLEQKELEANPEKAAEKAAAKKEFAAKAAAAKAAAEKAAATKKE
jgi:hypothetical protein